MFRWLKRRLVKEHQKLLFQNEAAATDPELKTRLLFLGQHEAAMSLDGLSLIAMDMLAKGVPSNGLQPDHCEIGLRINKELRLLFEIGYEANAAQFDPKYTPLGGWDCYNERKAEGS